MIKSCKYIQILRSAEPQTWFAVSFLWLIFLRLGTAQEPPDMQISADTKSQVISEIIQQLRSKYVFPKVAAQMETAIQSLVAKGEYVRITSARQFAERLQSDLRAVSKDQHLEVVYSYDPIPIQDANQEEKISPDGQARIRYRGRLVNYWFKNADVLPGNLGFLRFDGFFPLKFRNRIPLYFS